MTQRIITLLCFALILWLWATAPAQEQAPFERVKWVKDMVRIVCGAEPEKLEAAKFFAKHPELFECEYWRKQLKAEKAALEASK